MFEKCSSVNSDFSGDADRGAAIGLIAAGVDALLGLDLDTLSDRQVLELMTALEGQARRVPAVMHRLVLVADQRRLARRQGLRDTAGLLRRELHLSAGEARARIAAAADLGGRSSDEGAPLPPVLPIAAAAQVDGSLSVAHLRVIRQAVERIPVELHTAHASGLEAELVVEAGRLDPARLAARANQLLARLDPEGLRRQDAEQQRLRGGTFALNPDGSADLRAHLTPAGAAIVQAVIMPLAAPRPDDAGGRDERTPAYRLHDALVEGCRRLLVARAVPGEGGVAATVLVTVPLAALHSADEGEGAATTQYGGRLSIHELLQMAGEAMVVPVVVDDRQVPLCVGRAKRFATKEQTYALIARDRGCTFPGCDHPPPWTQRHHIRAWASGGRTDLDNLALLCVYHHAHFEALGWECQMISGVVHWRPPVEIDPRRRPVRNTVHDLERAAHNYRATPPPLPSLAPSVAA